VLLKISMTRTISKGFEDFHNRLKLVASESEKVASHRSSIESCMKSNFSMNRFFRTGSIGNGTNVNGYSDTDYFAGIPRENLKENSITSLRLIKEALKDRFPNTSIYIDSPAVVVPFGEKASETTEIIPADYLRSENGSNIYDIPDGNGGWMKSSPSAQNKYVTDINSKLSFKLKPLIRFIKAWKFYNNVPISSFYLEMRITKYASEESTIIYSHDIKAIFRILINNNLADMNNPVGVSGSIKACSSLVKKEDAISKLKTAHGRVEKAVEYEDKGDIKTAFFYWNLLFNDRFPSYYE
jgi:hypothetical protein